MSAPIVSRRNNLKSSVQVQEDHRTVDELRDELQRFGVAFELTVSQAREAAESAQAETARLR